MLRAHGPKDTRSGGAGLERSCRGAGGDRIESIGPADGVELFRARLGGAAYETHRHDTYAVGLTDHGVQAFDYRGAARVSMPGEVVALYPDEAHDGRAGTAAGFGYRLVYVEPARMADALRAIHGRPGAAALRRRAGLDEPAPGPRHSRGLRRPRSSRWAPTRSSWR